jgi:hypothetical protein
MSTTTIVVGVIAIIVILFLILEFTGSTSITPLSQINGNDLITTSLPPGTADLCEIVEVLGDPEPQCTGAGGNWVCEHDSIGCFNIPLWNVSNCDTSNAGLMKGICSSFDADWTCNIHEVSCVR